MSLSKLFSLKVVFNNLHQINPKSHILSELELKNLQYCLVSIYKDIFDTCEKYGIKPFLQGGTLLGKIRHNGFIPWDDDLDLGMSRTDYEKFKKIFERELGEAYLLKCPGYPMGATNRFIQVFKKDTYFRTTAMPDKIPHHVYIDIFPIDFAPQKRWKQIVKGTWCNFLMGVTSCVEFKETFTEELRLVMSTTKSGKINMYLRMFIGEILSVISLENWYLKTDKALNEIKPSNYCTSGTGRKHYLGELVKTEVFFPLKRAKFEGCSAWIPNLPEEYLENLYGDYMRIPDKKNQEQHFIEDIKISIT